MGRADVSARPTSVEGIVVHDIYNHARFLHGSGEAARNWAQKLKLPYRGAACTMFVLELSTKGDAKHAPE
jgi:hypothetical protein